MSGQPLSEMRAARELDTPPLAPAPARAGGAVPSGVAGTLIIDDPHAGGSEAGAWARAIRDTPRLAAMEAG